ncbi:hypothetical protein MTO96_017975 [Rhipicephalus appendiculatus]
MYIPDDGLCDYSFFDSLAITPGSNTFAATTQSADAQRFVTQAQVDQKTRYGMSVSLRDIVTFSNAFRSGKGKTDYESYWIFNVYHWGFLHIDELQAEMHEHALSTAGQTPGTFLGIYMRSKQSCATVAGYISTIFAPTGVIVLGHLSYGDSWRPDCAIMPPINYVDPRPLKPGIGYGHSMRDAMDAVACLRNQGVRTSLSVSVTMQARRYKLTSTGQGPALFYNDCTPGTYEQRTTAQEICDDRKSGYSRNIFYAAQYESLATYDDTDGFAVTFENAISLRAKLCDAWSAGAITIPVGLAVYDANYDRRSSRCDHRWINGTWFRFHFLLRLRDFLHQAQPSSSFLPDCNQFT